MKHSVYFRALLVLLALVFAVTCVTRPITASAVVFETAAVVGVPLVLGVAAILIGLGALPLADPTGFNSLCSTIGNALDGAFKITNAAGEAMLSMLQIGGNLFAGNKLSQEVLDLILASSDITVIPAISSDFNIYNGVVLFSHYLDYVNDTCPDELSLMKYVYFVSHPNRNFASIAYFTPDLINYVENGNSYTSGSYIYTCCYVSGVRSSCYYSSSSTLGVISKPKGPYSLSGQVYLCPYLSFGNLAEDLDDEVYAEWNATKIIEFPNQGTGGDGAEGDGSGDDSELQTYYPLYIAGSVSEMLNITQSQAQAGGQTGLTTDQIYQTGETVQIDPDTLPDELKNPETDPDATSPVEPDETIPVVPDVPSADNQPILDGMTNILDAIESIPSTIVDAILSIPNLILEGIRDIFVPSEDFLTAKVDALRANFGFVDSIIDTGQALGDALLTPAGEPPVIYVELNQAEGSIDWGDRAVILDMSFYEPYKATGDTLMGAFLWAAFAWRMFVRLPSLISGGTGDAPFFSGENIGQWPAPSGSVRNWERLSAPRQSKRRGKK